MNSILKDSQRDVVFSFLSSQQKGKRKNTQRPLRLKRVLQSRTSGRLTNPTEKIPRQWFKKKCKQYNAPASNFLNSIINIFIINIISFPEVQSYKCDYGNQGHESKKDFVKIIAQIGKPGHFLF